MTQHHIDGKTIKISAFSQIIAKDSQGVKTLKGSKTPQKYLNKKDNFWLKMHSREVTTWPTYRKLKRSTYVKKCKSIPTMFTSNYNPLQLTQWRPKPCYGFSLSLCNQSMSLYLFLPPFPTYHIISPPPSLAKLKQCFLWIKYTNAKDIPYPLGPKKVLNTLLQSISTRSAFAEKNVYVMSPLWLSRGPGRNRCLDNQKKIC